MGPMRWSETTRVVPPHSHSHSVTRPYVIKTLMKINNGQKIEPFFFEVNTPYHVMDKCTNVEEILWKIIPFFLFSTILY